MYRLDLPRPLLRRRKFSLVTVLSPPVLVGTLLRPLLLRLLLLLVLALPDLWDPAGWRSRKRGDPSLWDWAGGPRELRGGFTLPLPGRLSDLFLLLLGAALLVLVGLGAAPGPGAAAAPGADKYPPRLANPTERGFIPYLAAPS